MQYVCLYWSSIKLDGYKLDWNKVEVYKHTSSAKKASNICSYWLNRPVQFVFLVERLHHLNRQITLIKCHGFHRVGYLQNMVKLKRLPKVTQYGGDLKELLGRTQSAETDSYCPFGKPIKRQYSCNFVKKGASDNIDNIKFLLARNFHSRPLFAGDVEAFWCRYF